MRMGSGMAWADYQQNRKIRALEDDLASTHAYAAERSRSLQAKLSQVQGTLERRLDRLATAFDAFVELSDLRQELAVFDEEAKVRHRVRRLLAELAQGAADAPPLGLKAELGYWLAPAAEALAALARGDEVAAEGFAAEASALDESRTTLFLTVALAAVGRPSLAAPWLARALPTPGSTVTRVQRRLWIACAEGVFGEAGRAHAERCLVALVESLPDETAAKERELWIQAAASGAGKEKVLGLPRALQGESTLNEPPAYAARLSRLRARIEETLAVADEAPGRTDAVGRTGGAGARPESGDEVIGGSGGTALAVDAADGAAAEQGEGKGLADHAELAATLNALVEEGSPHEQALLRRARELRQIIEQGAAATADKAWDDPAGATLTLLRHDMFEESRPALRALALRAGREWVAAAAGDLAEKASRRPPERVRAQVGGQHLWIRTDGPEALDEAEAQIDAAYAVGSGAEWAGRVLTAGGVAAIVISAVAVVAPLIVVSAVATVTGAGIWIKQWLDRRRFAEAAAREKARLAGDARQIAEALAAYQARHKELAASAGKDRDAILSRLS